MSISRPPASSSACALARSSLGQRAMTMRTAFARQNARSSGRSSRSNAFTRTVRTPKRSSSSGESANRGRSGVMERSRGAGSSEMGPRGATASPGSIEYGTRAFSRASRLHPMLARGLSVIVPVYRSAPILPSLVARLEPVLRAAAPAFELVLVDDASPDESWRVISELARKHPWVRGMCMMRNFGQHGALLCGIRAARYDVIVTMDDDLQHPPAEISKLLATLADGHDVVYGTPMQEQHDVLRNLASRLTKLALSSSMGAASASQVSAFRAFPMRLRAAFSEYRSPSVSIDVLLTWATANFVAIKVRHEPRLRGRSNYTVGKLITHAFNLMTGFSTRPLRLA